MANYSLDIEGFESLSNKLASMVDNIDRVEEIALGKGAFILQRAQISEVPVKTGRLKRALKVGPIKTDTDGIRYRAVGDVDRKAEYGWIVEAKYNPFMARSLRKSRRKISQEINNTLSKELIE